MILPSTSENLDRAAVTIRNGGLVVIPTETVYGLAADATNPEAVRAIFAAKSRPADNPLIVHIAHLEQVQGLTLSFPEEAAALAEHFWPGPLTLVMQKGPSVPMEVTGGLDTIAIRMPDHPVALEVIRRSGRPLAAPSANRFMALSPTRAEHVDSELAPIILDGGPCRVGLESTVIDCSEGALQILRAGGIGRRDIEGLLGRQAGTGTSTARRSPGMYPRHYAPNAKLHLIYETLGDRPGISFVQSGQNQICLPLDPVDFAAALYNALHHLDSRGLANIYVESPPLEPEWEAVHDRLNRMIS
jgi:L-threonylcarbamoyladenylate synthase